jgi:cytoskeletal protein CcmA (bactofilin family)
MANCPSLVHHPNFGTRPDETENTKREADMAVAQPLAQPTPVGVAHSNTPSIISGDLTITGKLVADGNVQVDGRVDGDIRARGVVIGQEALVKGDIYAEEAVIRGRVEGSIRARKVQLMSTAHVGGNIVHGRQLSVDIGAYFEGSVKSSDNPLAA